jgi:hypothetical protein
MVWSIIKLGMIIYEALLESDRSLQICNIYNLVRLLMVSKI